MKDYNELLEDLKFIDNIVTNMFPEDTIEIYLVGGSACILAGYLERATRDFDIINIGYSSKIGKLLNYLSPYDLLDIDHSEIPHGFRNRARKLENFNNINVYVLSREDIIASKIGRYEEKDKIDIVKLMPDIDIELLLISINDVLDNMVNPNRKARYKKHLIMFKNEHNLEEN